MSGSWGGRVCSDHFKLFGKSVGVMVRFQVVNRPLVHLSLISNKETMTDELLEAVKNLEDIKDPEVCNLLRGELNGYLSHLEEQEWVERLEVSRKKKELLASLKKVNQVEIEIEFTPQFETWEKTKRRINEVKGIRSDLKDRFLVLQGKKQYY